LPRIAAAWPEGRCELCLDPELRAGVARDLQKAAIRLAAAS